MADYSVSWSGDFKARVKEFPNTGLLLHIATSYTVKIKQLHVMGVVIECKYVLFGQKFKTKLLALLQKVVFISGLQFRACGAIARSAVTSSALRRAVRR
jgi:hypothetical protein